MLIGVYDRNTSPPLPPKDLATGRLGPRLSGNVPLRDAHEFELEGLMTDDEDENENRRKHTQEDDDSLNSPSTIGKNSDGVAR
jgi:hypothetical protein